MADPRFDLRPQDRAHLRATMSALIEGWGEPAISGLYVEVLEGPPTCRRLAVQREIAWADAKYGDTKRTRPPGWIAAICWWLLFRGAKLLMRRGGADRWSRVLIEEVAEAMCARVTAGRRGDVDEHLACELVQVEATASRWLRDLERQGVTPRQSWPDDFLS